MELMSISEERTIEVSNSGYVTTDVTTGRQYKVRLATYSEPIWFDINRVNDIGIIEQWSKGDWTIFLLGGYPDKEAAERARLAAKMRGFKDAQLVMDNNGILEKAD